MKHAWILFDGRPESGDTDNASVLEFAGTSIREVRSALHFWKGTDGVLAEYDVGEPETLTNERIIGHLREGAKSLLARCSRE